MKAVAIIFVALGLLTVPSSGIQSRLKANTRTSGPKNPNRIITFERFDKIKNRT